jgi:DNA-binding HxlR family transcriptional regulator
MTPAINTRVLTNQRTLQIVARLSHGPLRFNELERAIRVPNPVILSKLLKRLMRDNVVIREVVELGPPAHTRYHLSALGMSLAKPASAMLEWLGENVEQIKETRKAASLVNKAAQAESLAVA